MVHRGNPNMNSLIGLGALTSFAAGVAGPLAPGMAFDTSFLEEPVMLLAFVLLGRSLEARARLRASGARPFPHTPREELWADGDVVTGLACATMCHQA